MVREYRSSDLHVVVALFGRSVREVASRDYSPDQISAWAPDPPDLAAWSQRLGSGAVYVCERQNQISGFSRIDEDGLIDLLYVHPAFQRQGVAGELMNRMCSWARQRRIRWLTAEVSRTARPFFEHRGFHAQAQHSVERRGVSFSTLQMARALDIGPHGPTCSF